MKRDGLDGLRKNEIEKYRQDLVQMRMMGVRKYEKDGTR